MNLCPVPRKTHLPKDSQPVACHPREVVSIIFASSCAHRAYSRRPGEICSPEVIYCNRGIAVCAERISVCALIKWAVYSNFNGIGKCLSPICGFNNNNSIRIVSMCKTTEGNIYCSSGWITWINGNPGSLNNMLTFAQFDGFAPSGTTVCGPGKDNSTPGHLHLYSPKKTE